MLENSKVENIIKEAKRYFQHYIGYKGLYDNFKIAIEKYVRKMNIEFNDVAHLLELTTLIKLFYEVMLQDIGLASRNLFETDHVNKTIDEKQKAARDELLKLLLSKMNIDHSGINSIEISLPQYSKDNTFDLLCYFILDLFSYLVTIFSMLFFSHSCNKALDNKVYQAMKRVMKSQNFWQEANRYIDINDSEFPLWDEEYGPPAIFQSHIKDINFNDNVIGFMLSFSKKYSNENIKKFFEDILPELFKNQRHFYVKYRDNDSYCINYEAVEDMLQPFLEYDKGKVLFAPHGLSRAQFLEFAQIINVPDIIANLIYSYFMLRLQIYDMGINGVLNQAPLFFPIE